MQGLIKITKIKYDKDDDDYHHYDYNDDNDLHHDHYHYHVHDSYSAAIFRNVLSDETLTFFDK